MYRYIDFDTGLVHTFLPRVAHVPVPVAVSVLGSLSASPRCFTDSGDDKLGTKKISFYNEIEVSVENHFASGV